MKTVIIEYSVTSPMVLANRVEKAFNCLTAWREINEDFFEFSVMWCEDLKGLEDILAEYV